MKKKHTLTALALFTLSICLLASLLALGCSSPGATPSSTPPTTEATQSASPAAVTSPSASTPAQTTTGATSSADKYGGVLKWIDRFVPSQPIGAPFDAPLSVPSEQVCLAKIIGQNADGTLTPELATSWDIDASAQSPSITFHLRQGVKFQDGTDFNAQAVQWNLEQFKNDKMFANTVSQTSFDVIDNYTIRINYNEWKNAFPPSFAGIQGYMVSPTAYQNNGIDWLRWHMVGAGPFKQTDFQQDVSLTTARNPYYYEPGKPYLDGIQFLYVTDPLTQVALFKSGGAEVLQTDPKTATEFQSPGYVIKTFPNACLALWPDSANPSSAWANEKVREAAEYAIDKTAIAKTFGYGYYDPAYQLPSPNSTAYDPAITGRTYDPAKAKQLLAEAGYPNGFKTKIIAPNSGDNSNLVTALQSYLGAVGIQADIELPAGAKFASYMGGTWDNAVVVGMIIEIANYNLSFNNFLSYPATLYKSTARPPDYPQLYADTLGSKDVDPALQQKVVQSLYDNDSVIPLYYTKSIWVLTDNVQDSGIGDKVMYWNSQNTWLSK